MSFYNKYELVEVLRDDGVKTFLAREIGTGQAVEVHLIVGQPGKSEPPFELLEKIRAMAPENKTHVIEVGDHSGTPYVVTLPLAGFSSFRDWVAAKSAEPKPGYDPFARVGKWKIPIGQPPTTPPPPPSLSPAGPNPVVSRILPPEAPDVTRMFNTAQVVLPSKQPAQEPKVPTQRIPSHQQPKPAAAPPPPAMKPSEGDDFDSLFSPASTAQVKRPPAPTQPDVPQPFNLPPPSVPIDDITRMFSTQSEIQAAKLPTSSPPVSQESSSVTAQIRASDPPKPVESGDRMFQSPGRTGQMPPPEPANREPGEFTKMFRIPSATGERKAAPAPAAPAASTSQVKAPEPPKPAEPDSFTRMFQSSQMKSALPGETGQMKVTEPPKPSDPGGFTGLFQSPPASSTAQMKSPGPAPSQTKIPEPAKPSEPDSFTGLFQATGSMPASPAKTPEQPKPAEPAKQEPGGFTQMFEAASKSATGHLKRPPPPKPVEPPPQGPGEFTRMFQVGEGGPSPTTSPTPPSFPKPVTSAQPLPPAQGPGEFTRMFQTQSGELVTPPSSPELKFSTQQPPAPAPGAKPGQPPGEFTRMFSASPGLPTGDSPLGGGHSSPPPTAQPPKQDAGEFTRMFSSPGSLPKQQLPVAQPAQSPLSNPNPFAAPTAPLPPPMVKGPAPSPFGQQPQSPFGQQPPSPFGQQQGGIGSIPQRPYGGPSQPSVNNEYEKLFGGAGPSKPVPPLQAGALPPAPQPAPPIAPLGGATQAFHTPQFSSAPPQPQQQAGPSEYTRMFNAPKDSPAAPSSPPLPAVASAAKSSPKWPIFVFGGVILIIIIGLIVTLWKK